MASHVREQLQLCVSADAVETRFKSSVAHFVSFVCARGLRFQVGVMHRTEEGKLKLLDRRTPEQLVCLLKAACVPDAHLKTSRSQILRYCAANFNKLCSAESFHLIQHDVLKELLVSKDLHISCPHEVLHNVARWVRFDSHRRLFFEVELFPLLPFDENRVRCRAAIVSNWDVYRFAHPHNHGWHLLPHPHLHLNIHLPHLPHPHLHLNIHRPHLPHSPHIHLHLPHHRPHIFHRHHHHDLK